MWVVSQRLTVCRPPQNTHTHTHTHTHKTDRDTSARAFRDQVDRFQQLLLTAPVVVLQDVGARCREECERYTGVELRRFKKSVKAYEAVKKRHREALTPQLSDPNELPALQALCTSESQRVADVRACIAAARGKVLDRQRVGASGFMARLLFYTDKLLKFLDNTIIRTDLAALPGDESLVPDRMSLKRLKKNLRKREAEQAAAGAEVTVEVGPATKVLRPRTWKGIPTNEFVVPPKPHWLVAYEAEHGGGDGAGKEAEEGGGDAAAAAADAKKGGKKGGKAKKDAKNKKKGKAAKDAPKDDTKEGEEGGEAQADTSPSVSSFYTPSTRHTVHARRSVYDEFLKWYHDHIGHADALCAKLWQSEGEWERNWSKMVLFLQEQAA